MTNQKIVALVPLRGGSKSIPGKNIKPIAGLPLCAWVLKAAVAVDAITEVYVSTDSDEIAEVVNKLNIGIKVLKRPAEYASDEASTESVMLHFAEHVEFDLLVTIQATSPLLSAQDLDKAVQQFQSEDLDSMLTAVRSYRFYWRDDAIPINYDPQSRPRRQDFAGTLMENGAFYITRREALLQSQCRLAGKIGIYEMAENTAVEIDEPEDWLQLERLLASREERSQ